MSMASTKEVKFKSLCSFRKKIGLGCDNCVLKGFIDCPESGGVGEKYQANFDLPSRVHDVTSYKLHWNDLDSLS